MENSNLDADNPNLDVTSEFGQIPADELGRRITAVIDLYDSRKIAAQVAGVHVDSLYRYMRGQQVPPFDVIAKLCSSKAVSMDWVASGHGNMRVDDRGEPPRMKARNEAAPSRLEQPVDMLATIIATVDQLVADLGIKADAHLKAQLVAAIYQSAEAAGSIEPVVEKLRLTLSALHAKSA